jgi:hypothetical protein
MTQKKEALKESNEEGLWKGRRAGGESFLPDDQ